MTSFEQWDVVTALFPFIDVPGRKPRPILVLSSEVFNGDHAHLIGCMITTGARSRWPTDHQIEDLSAAGLSHASVVRWKLFTLPLDLIGRKIGVLTEADRADLIAQRRWILP